MLLLTPGLIIAAEIAVPYKSPDEECNIRLKKLSSHNFIQGFSSRVSAQHRIIGFLYNPYTQGLIIRDLFSSAEL
jgi:hypothetical protein